MRFARDQDRARWLPSRRRFALSRLIALIAFRVARPSPAQFERVLHAIDRDHDQAENYFVSLWISVTAFAYLASALPLRPFPASLLALALLPIVLQIPFYSAPLLDGFRGGDRRSFTSRFYVFLVLAASLYFGALGSPVRYVAWIFLGICAANVVAAAIMWFARGEVARMEAECGL